MKKLVATSCVGFWTLALFSGCGGGGSHAQDAGGKKDTGTEAGGDGAANDGGDGGIDAGPDAASCPGAGMCGGNIVGSWSIASSCLDVDVSGAVPDYCQAATAQPMGFQLAGTLTYRADLTYSKKTTVSGKIVLTFPASCLTGGDGGASLTCDQLATQLKLDPTYADVSCAGAGSGCACTSTLVPQSQTMTGMYTTTAAGLLVEAETGHTPPDMSDYCVKTDTLTTSPQSMRMGMMSATGTISASRVLVPDAGVDGGSDATNDASPDAGSEARSDAGADATAGN